MVYSPDLVRKAYDSIAEREDEFERSFSVRNEIPREFIKKYLRPSDIVLDAGGGAGLNAILMAQRCERVDMVDISPRLLALASKNIEGAGMQAKIRVSEGDISHLDQLSGAEYSLTVCVGGVLSYTLDRGRQAVQELVRVTRTGGTLIIGCDAKYGFVRWLFHELEEEHRLEAAQQVFETGEYEAGDGVFAHLYTADELKALIVEAGCEVLETASTPILVDSWEQSAYPKEDQQRLKQLEMELCTVPELLGAGHHILFVARKKENSMVE